ncbi:MAG: hypothetical protein ACLVJH_17745 [Faecalibacterium prausnitzii]
MEHFGVKLVMNWYSAIFASIVVAFPLMYRTARGAFESFDETLAWSAQTLGQSDVLDLLAGADALPAVRAFWPARCWPLPARWASTVPPA